MSGYDDMRERQAIADERASLVTQLEQMRRERDAAVALREDAEARAETCASTHASQLARLRDEREALQHVMRTWEMRYEEVMRERDEARAKLARIRSIAVVRHDLQIDAAMSDVVRIIDEKEGGM